MISATSPIGVFDSGIGGLSVLQALRRELPHEHFVYLADSGNAPYGERGDAFVAARTHAIAEHLRAQYQIKALVIACNTATAAAVESLRAAMPELPLIGVEPAIKPAAACSQTQHVGVIATRGTVESRRFKKLLAEHGAQVAFHVQACDGLARAIEASTLQQQPPVDGETTEIEALSARYINALGQFGLKTGEMDTLVLGCTHYIFIKDELRALLGPEVQLMDTGAPVARQTRRMLAKAGTLQDEPAVAGGPSMAGPAQITLMTTGNLLSLQAAAQRWLQLPASCCQQASLPV